MMKPEMERLLNAAKLRAGIVCDEDLALEAMAAGYITMLSGLWDEPAVYSLTKAGLAVLRQPPITNPPPPPPPEG